VQSAAKNQRLARPGTKRRFLARKKRGREEERPEGEGKANMFIQKVITAHPVVVNSAHNAGAGMDFAPVACMGGG